jgi:hypothetical protein
MHIKEFGEEVFRERFCGGFIEDTACGYSVRVTAPADWSSGKPRKVHMYGDKS